MIREATFAAYLAFATRGLEQQEVRGQGGARRRRVPQVDGDAAEEQRLPAHAGILEADGELLVFRAPADEIFVEAVHALEVVAPVALVAALDRDDVVGDAAHGIRERGCAQ